MFPWGGEINYEGTSLILSLLQLFLMCTGNGKTTLCRLRTCLLSSPLIRIFHVRGGGGACFWLPPFRPGVQKKPFSASCVNNLQELPVPKLSRSSAIQ